MNPRANQPSVSVLLLNYNGWKDTVECLESLFRLDFENFNVVVVDNASTDGSIDNIINWASGKLSFVPKNPYFESYLESELTKPVRFSLIDGANEKLTDKFEKLILIKHHVNGGFSSGNNVGLRFIKSYLRSDYIWLLNNDTFVKADSLSNLVSKMLSYSVSQKEKVSFIGTQLQFYYEPDKVQALVGRYNPLDGTTSQIINSNVLSVEKLNAGFNYPVGASIFLSKSFLDRVGLLNENYFLYYEELDWVLRGRKKGEYFDILTGEFVFHKEGASTGAKQSTRCSVVSDVNILYSRLIFSKQFFPFMHWFVLLNVVLIGVKRLFLLRFDCFNNVVVVLKRFINFNKKVDFDAKRFD